MSEGFYTPEADVTEERNGVQFLVAPAGIPIPMEEARRLGLVKDQKKPVGPQETKAPEEGPSEEPLGEADKGKRGK